MRYTEIHFTISPYNEAAADVLAALLADSGCDTFESTDNGLTAYILQSSFNEDAIKEAVITTISTFACGGTSGEKLAITFTAEAAPDENWNACWEAEHHFEPITLPDGQQIRILPRQAFGSGEHATTRMILKLLAEVPLAHATVIDAGCGTGILGIAALKMGAAHVFAYDIDEWSTRNAEENYSLNGVLDAEAAEIVLGDASVLDQAPKADVVMANINRNILLADMPAFVKAMKNAAQLVLSGFYEADIAPLTQRAEALGLKLTSTYADGDWRALLLNNVHTRA